MPLWDIDAQKMRKDKANLREYSDDINLKRSRNASAPNFIHSLDATLLMKAVLLSHERGVSDVMVVHDSFSTTIDNVDTMVTAIKRSLVDLFDNYCPYDELHHQTMQRIGDKVLLPDRLDLDIHEVMDNDFFVS